MSLDCSIFSGGGGGGGVKHEFCDRSPTDFHSVWSAVAVDIESVLNYREYLLTALYS